MSLEEEAQEDSLEPVASGSAEPDHGRTCSGHGAEAASRPGASLTGTVFGPQLPVGSVGVSDLSTDKPKVENTRGLGAAVRVEATGRFVPLRSVVFFSLRTSL